ESGGAGSGRTGGFFPPAAACRLFLHFVFHHRTVFLHFIFLHHPVLLHPVLHHRAVFLHFIFLHHAVFLHHVVCGIGARHPKGDATGKNHRQQRFHKFFL